MMASVVVAVQLSSIWALHSAMMIGQLDRTITTMPMSKATQTRSLQAAITT